MQLAIVQGDAGNVQRRPFGALNEALFKSLDQRLFSQFQQSRMSRGIAAMEVREAIEKQQVFALRDVNVGGRFGVQEILGVPGVATDQQRHVIDQFRHRAQTQRLAVARGFIGDGQASEQRRVDGE
ncbi:hypothetical protein D3C84_829040 [compost metagenome]